MQIINNITRTECPIDIKQMTLNIKFNKTFTYAKQSNKKLKKKHLGKKIILIHAKFRLILPKHLA